MSKPDWATRLQRTFARKYDAGFAKGLMFGKAVATRDEQERIIKLLEPLTICDEGCDHYDCGTWGYQHAIALIKGENK